MNTRSSKVREIFDQVAEIAGESERRTFLDAACEGDTDLRGEVDALLQAYGDAGSFLDRPALDMAALGQSGQTEAFAGTSAPAGSDASATEENSAAQRDDDPLAFLSPSAKPEHLGRLGHYEILEVIGKGGFGTVLRAFDEKLHRVSAIKVLAPAYAANGSARKRFSREARSAAAVKNDHVVAVYGVQDEIDPPYLVMELIDGISLQEKLDRKGPLTPKEILRIGMQMAEGLAAAHKQGLVHRDIKPVNILLENGVERVKITDFGLARAVDDASVTQSGTVAGTPMYMSPEQAEGLTIDHRSDLFSLGTVLYAMCTGHPPFRASGTHAVLKRVIDASPRPIREINNEVPDWLCDIIAKLHAKKPEDRFQTATEVAELLGQHLAHLQQPSTVARPPAVALSAPKPEKPWRVGDQVLAPLVPEWLYVCKVLEVEDDLVLVTFEGAHSAWVPTDDVLPDLIGKDTRVLGFVGWMSGHHPGTVTERRGDQVHVLYDNGSSKWTKLNKIVVPTDKLSKSGAVVPIEPSNPNAIFESQVVAPPYIHHAVRRFLWLGLLGMVLGAGAGLAIGFTYPTLMPWIGGEVNRDTVLLLALFGGVFGVTTAMVTASRFLLADVRSRMGIPTAAATQPDRVPLKTKIAEGAMIIAGIGVMFMAVARPTTTPAGLALAVAAGALCAVAAILMIMSVAAPWPWVKSAGWLAMIGLVGVLLGGIIVGFVRQGDLPWQANREVESDKPQAKNPPPEALGWVQLFNGKDLSGWSKHKRHIGNWHIEDKQLVCSEGDNACLFSDRADFKDFHLRLEYKLERGIASAIVRASQGGEIEPLVFGLAPPGAVIDLPVSSKEKNWRCMEVVCIGNQCKVKRNDQPFEELLLPKSAGYIALQSIGAAIHVRKIEIKELPSTAPPLAVSPFEAKKAHEHQDAWAMHLGVPVEIENSIGMKLRLIPPGEFMMGSSKNEIDFLLTKVADLKNSPDWLKNRLIEEQGPAQPVTLSNPYLIGVHEVTVGQFRQFVVATNYKTEAEKTAGGYDWNRDELKWEKHPGNVWTNPLYAKDDALPVVFVTLADARAFCDWLTKKEGRRYAVPTEAQWEFACRAGTNTLWSFGDDRALFPRYAWNVPPTDFSNWPVGQLGANPFGLFDMHGNAGELTTNPQGHPVERGSTIGLPPERCRSASRYLIEKEYDPNCRRGFRVAVIGGLKSKTP